MSEARIRTTLLQKVGLVTASLVMAEILLRVAGATYTYFQHGLNHPHVTASNELRILCLGESTTAWGFSNAYPRVLEQMLRKEYPGHDFSVINEGIGGTSTQEIADDLAGKVAKYKPQIVTLMMGVNDTWLLGQRIRHRSLLSRFFYSLRLVKFARIAWVDITHRTASGIVRAQTGVHAKDDLPPLPAEYELGKKALVEGREHEAEREFRIALRKQPSARLYGMIGDLYYYGGGDSNARYKAEARPYAMKALQLAPNDPAVIELVVGTLEFRPGHPKFRDSSFRLLERGVKQPGADANLFLTLGNQYEYRGLYKEAETTFEKGATLSDPNSHYCVLALINLEYKIGHPQKGEQILEEALRKNPNNLQFQQTASDHGIKLNQTQVTDYTQFYRNPITIRNYKRVIAYLQGKSILPVIVQYPRLPLAPLENALGSPKGVLFVSNRTNFEQALRTHKFTDLFLDSFAGKFGHFTRLGSELVAQNIIDALAKDGVMKKTPTARIK